MKGQPPIRDYLSLVFRRAIKRSFETTDQLAVFAALIAPAFARVRGLTIASAWTELIAIWVLSFIGGFIVLRLVSAPYFIWRDQGQEIERLKNELERPEQTMRQRMVDHVATIRAELAQELAEAGQRATTYEWRENLSALLAPNRAEELITQISYDEELASACREYLHACKLLIVRREKREDDREDRALVAALGKKVFGLLHSRREASM